MLNYTTKEVIADRDSLVINPCKTCQPVGAMYAALGVHACLPHSHGSQGCAAFHRMYLTRHFKDPIQASTSSFTEGASVFGGGSNLKTAAKNIMDIYNPDIIAVHTTCLSETIGDDLNALLTDITPTLPEGKYIVHCNTPSYSGSHINGFFNMVNGFLKYLVKPATKANGKLAIFPGWGNPGDYAELKRLLNLMQVPFIMLPDTDGVVDTPLTGTYEMYPAGGTKISDIQDMGNCKASLGLGTTISTPCVNFFEKSTKIKGDVLPYPMGIQASDDFIMKLQAVSGTEVPKEIEYERGQLVDMMTDTHQYTYEKKAAIYGDPDTVLGIMQFCLELGMIPKYCITGTPSEFFESEGKALLTKYGVEGCTVQAATQLNTTTDLFLLHQWIKNDPVDILLGGTHGKYIARAEDIPLVRMGFPIIDRYVHYHMPLVGYRGAIHMLDKITNALMDYQDSHCDEKDVEMVM
ncbi:nitrogenase molybdenum-iron protein subunit beta [Anaerocolumna sp. MB42-C2]|uniref:nitrogenase molybdenum-iron protein subunit beta n=1 Tax=Anaerocolumna sp. MB42-C2 TaxID=3070997 RepID=UPI0027E1AE81|nr:nitrogenase molybdenum-iron protein subunit beta [Anaerocolumna sp. MB42-C2]WMJ88826.1 nitrogenase molybdenum-iron protein subunit beta [Anaerocolumna sp. MB42-C2]